MSCETCQTMKQHNLPIPDHPWSGITMDFVGPFPESLGKNYLWVIMCHLMSQVHLIPINTMTKTIELANEFLTQVLVRLHRLLMSIVSDCTRRKRLHDSKHHTNT